MPEIIQTVGGKHTEPKTPGFSGIMFKLIAALAMISGTAAQLFFGREQAVYQIMRFFGAISAPILCFLLVEGYHRTKNQRSYMTRILVVALAAYLLHRFFVPVRTPDDIVFPLMLASVSLQIFCGVQMPYSFRLPVIAMLAWWAQQSCSNGAAAILFVLTFEISRRYDLNMQIKAGLLAALCCLLPTLYLFVTAPKFAVQAVWEFGILLSMLPLRFYNGQRGSGNAERPLKWIFYLLYPVHLVALGLLKYALTA